MTLEQFADLYGLPGVMIGGLGFAVLYLWREVSKKDDMIMSLQEKRLERERQHAEQIMNMFHAVSEAIQFVRNK